MGGYTQAIQNQVFAGPQQPNIINLVASQTLPSPCGTYALAKTVAGVITITIPAPIAGPQSAGGDDGKISIFINNQAQVNILSFTGATLLSVGVAKTTCTFTAGLVGEFIRVMSMGLFYIAMDIVTTGGGTLA